MNVNASYHTQQCNTSNTRNVHASQKLGAGSVARLCWTRVYGWTTLLVSAAQLNVGCSIRSCDTICENILVHVCHILFK